MATKSFTMPDLGEGIHEAEVLAVLVAVGQQVQEGETILEVETDKAAVEIPSPCTGTVAEVIVRAGEVVKVGEVLITFGEGDQPAAPVPETVEAVEEPYRKGAATRPIVPASPATRRLARELGVDLHLVTPTGAGDIVTADDVRTFAEANRQPAEQPAFEPMIPAAPVETGPQASTLPDFSRWGAVERQPFRSIRRATAVQMTRSWSQVPHVTCQDTVDVTELEAFRQKHKAEIEAAGGRLTMTVFALKAVATALKNFPHFNATLDLAAGEIIVKHYFHVGVAVDTEHGLMVPVIRDIDRKSIKELAIEVHDCVVRTRSRQISRDELQGGTFTITNAGAMGGGFFSPIINYPEVAILGLGEGRMQPTVVTDNSGEQTILPRLIMPIMLCFDHRVVDGADAIRFLQVVMGGLKDPDELLITMI